MGSISETFRSSKIPRIVNFGNIMEIRDYFFHLDLHDKIIINWKTTIRRHLHVKKRRLIILA